MTSSKRRAGGSYRRTESLISLYAKSGKDRSKANRKQHKHKDKKK